MDYQIVQVNQNTWRIEDNGVRIFLLAGEDKALLIDSGMQLTNARDIAESLTSLPVELLNTHADMDHIGSNEQFDSFYMHPAEETNYRRSGKGGRLIPVQDGDELDLGNRKLRIIHLPGHTPGSIAVLDIASRVLISGDPVQEHGRIFMFGDQRNLNDYRRSLEKLEQMAEELFGLRLLHHRAQIHHRHPVADVTDHGHFVRDKEHGQLPLLPKIRDQVQNLCLDRHIQ